MNTPAKIVRIAFYTLITLSIAGLPGAASAAYSRPYYKPCSVIAQELGRKIARLKRLAAERRAQGDRYGERRLRSTANVINAHRGNLPCVNRQTCAL